MMKTTKRALLLDKTLTIAILMGAIATVVGLPQAAFAQFESNPSVQPLEDPLNPSRSDPFSSRGSSQTGGVMDLIHRAIQGQGRSAEEFSEEQDENLDDAAAQFRKLQQQRLQNQQGTAPATSAPAPSAPTNQ